MFGRLESDDLWFLEETFGPFDFSALYFCIISPLLLLLQHTLLFPVLEETLHSSLMDSANVGRKLLTIYALTLIFFVNTAKGEDIYLEWNVSIDSTIRPVNVDQPVIAINGMFPGPLVNATTNDDIHVNIFNNLDEPLLMTWNGIQQRLNSWEDGVSGTNCPIGTGKNWTYVFRVKDQIGSFFYFPSTRFQKAGGGFGPIRVNNRVVIPVPFLQPEGQFDVLIGDWYNSSYKEARGTLRMKLQTDGFPEYILFNGKPPYNNSWGGCHESFTVTRGKTYLLRISNVGRELSLNFRIQNHEMVLVETEGSYTNQITLNSLDVHVGQSYSLLVTAKQDIGDYYMVATPTQINSTAYPDTRGIAILHYDHSTNPANGPLPSGPNQLDRDFSLNQAKSIRWNMTTGAARPNRQGTFNVTNVTMSQTFILHSSKTAINNITHYTINNVSYLTPDTPLKLADYYLNGSGVYKLDAFPVNSTNPEALVGTSVVSGIHKDWLQIVFTNHLDVMDTWHFGGFGFYVVGYGDGRWNEKSNHSYNLYDPVVRSSIQVYPKGWSAVYVYLDNPGMWNLRSQRLENWYLGGELYVRVYDPDPNPAKEMLPPSNLLYCGLVGAPPAPEPPPPPPRKSSAPAQLKSSLLTSFVLIVLSKFAHPF